MTGRSRLVDGLATVNDRIEAARPMAAGGLATLPRSGWSATRTRSTRPSDRSRTGCSASSRRSWRWRQRSPATGSAARWVEAAVLVPYALLLAADPLAHSALGCGVPAPLAGLEAVVAPAHEALVVCRERYALEVVAGIGVVAEARTAGVGALEWPDRGPFG
jgi:hypothetical protein